MKNSKKITILISFALTSMLILSSCSVKIKLPKLPGIPNIGSSKGENKLEVSFVNGDTLTIEGKTEDISLSFVDETNHVFVVKSKNIKNDINGKVVRMTLEQALSNNATETSEILYNQSIEDSLGKVWPRMVWSTGETFYYATQVPLAEPTTVLLTSSSYDDLVKATDEINFKYIAGTGDNETPSDDPSSEVELPNAEVPEDIDVSSNDNDNDSISDFYIEYKIPSNFKIFSNDEDYKYYTSGDKYIAFSKYQSDESLDYLVSMYNAERKSNGNVDGYFYVSGDEYPTYTYQFSKNGWVYMVMSDSKKDIETVISTIK